MAIFTIDESTIGYGEVRASPDGSRRVFILKTNTADEWNLSSTLRLITVADIWDMCYMSLPDGTACLFFCVPHKNCIMVVEMVGGKTRWEAGKQQMGEEFEPRSICTDDDNTVYVADYSQNKIHLVSASDGTMVKCIDPGNYGIFNTFTVRFHDQHLYVEHRIPEQKYAITKFKQIKER